MQGDTQDQEFHVARAEVAPGDIDQVFVSVALGSTGAALAVEQEVGSSVDVDSATYLNSIGSHTLAALWSDPSSKPSEPAFYYLRVIEIPTPRWTAYDAKRFGDQMDPKVPMTTRERAYSSPIWYNP